MTILLPVLAAAAAATTEPNLPSPEFVQACFDRGQTQAEYDFCTAGKQESEEHKVHDAQALACLEVNLTQAGMNRCASEEYKRADAALNAQWKLTAAHAKEMDESAADSGEQHNYFQLLLDAQRAWLAYRDAECAAQVVIYGGGSIMPLVYSSCLTDLTRDRTENLKIIAEDV